MAYSNFLAGAVVMGTSEGKSALGRKKDGKFRGWGAVSLTGDWREGKDGSPQVLTRDPRRGGAERWLRISDFRGRFVKNGETIREYDNLF